MAELALPIAVRARQAHPAVVLARADLHCHTRHSDGMDTPAEMLKAAQDCGLQLLAVTDHDTIEGALEARRLAPEYGVEVVLGEEVSSSQGHILALFIQELIEPGLSARETIEAIHAQGGFAAAAHPFFRHHSWGGVGTHLSVEEMLELPWDAIEVENGAPHPAIWVGNRKARRVAAEHGLAVIGGSDAHGKEAVGWVQTLFAGSTAEDLQRALQRGITRSAPAHVHPGATVRYLARAAWHRPRAILWDLVMS